MFRLFPSITLLVVLVLSLALLPAGAQPSVAQATLPGRAADPVADLQFVPDRLLVRFRTGVQPGLQADGGWRTGKPSLDQLLADQQVQAAERLFPAMQTGGNLDPSGLSSIYVAHLASDGNVLQAVEAFSRDPGVEWAEPDYLAYPADTIPDDPLFAGQWGLAQIEAPAAWDVATGTQAVAIAAVDSGLDFAHPDLAGKLWVNPGEIADNGVDDDNNGYTDDVNGWDFVNDDNDPADDHGHGTQVAGVVAAETNNGAGVAGVCWGCRLMPVKVMQASGVANYSDIAQGVLYAAQKGARVINLSLGGYSDSYALKTAVQAATNTYGAVVVAGAGNDNVGTAFYPAAYDGVLAVAGTGQTDIKVAASNFGSWVDVSAPAQAITTTFLGGDYGAVDGTSYATPFAAGIAGLLRSENPDWPADMVRAQIIHTADTIDALNPGLEGMLGSGRVNADGAVSTAAQPLLHYESHTVNGIANGRPEPGSTVDLEVTLYNDWASAYGTQAVLSSSDPYVTIVNGSGSFGEILTYGTETNATPFRFSVSASAPYGQVMDLNLHVTAGGSYSADIPLNIQTASSVVYPPATITTQTWTNDRTYVINKETGIPQGSALTVEPGTKILFDGNYSLNVAGTLIADGTQEQPILFTTNKATPAPGDWGQIKFLDSSVDATFDGTGNYTGGSILRHATIEYGSGVSLDNAAPFIAHNTLDFDLGMVIDGIGSPGLVVAYNEITHQDDASYGIQLTVPSGDFWIIGNLIKGGMIGLSISGPGTIAGNSVGDVLNLGILAQGVLTVTANRVVNCDEGISADEGTISGNLLADNDRNGLRIAGGTPTVISNTIVSNRQAGIYVESGAPGIQHNNLIASPGGYALRNSTPSAISATNNWWGSSVESTIQEAIYDGLDEFGLGLVDYGSYLTSSESSAPAYVTDVHISPDTTLGIETATFIVDFNRPMDQSTIPSLSFSSVKRGWDIYNTSNSGLPNNHVLAVATDPDGSVWFATNGGGVAYFDGTNWTVYNTSNSGLPSDGVYAIATDPDGSHWFGTGGPGNGVAHFDGTSWTVYNSINSGLPTGDVLAITTDPDGSHWFGTYGSGVAHFDGTNWTVYNTSNSGLPDIAVYAIATDPDGSHWFGTGGPGNGVAHFDGTNWTVYNTSNSGLPGSAVPAIATDPDGSHWFGTWGYGVAHFDGANWKVYNTSNSGLPGNDVWAIATDPDGSHWFGTGAGRGAAHLSGTNWTVYNSLNSGLPAGDVRAITIDRDGSHWFGTWDWYGSNNGGGAVLWNKPVHLIENEIQWLNDHTYQSTYDITSLIERGEYLINISGAAGTDGIDIAPTVGYTFAVDYAGAIGDTTPPPIPAMEACAGVSADTLSASWSAFDPDSTITLYRYAIGTTPGGTDVINWINTPEPSFVRAGLNLIAGQTYFVAAKARNEGGIWSEAATAGVVAGSGECTTNLRRIYVPIVLRGE